MHVRGSWTALSALANRKGGHALSRQCISGRLREITKCYPDVASRRAGEVLPSDVPTVFLWKVDAIAVGVERLSICPINLGSPWIDLEPNRPAQGVQILHCDFNSAVLELRLTYHGRSFPIAVVIFSRYFLLIGINHW